MMVYAGGPIDYAEPDTDPHLWRHSLDEAGDMVVYCPVCIGRSGIEDSIVLGLNRWALDQADAAVFRLDGPTIGTPLEVEYWVRNRGVHSLVLVHSRPRGLVVRAWASLGVTVVDDLEGAMSWLESR